MQLEIKKGNVIQRKKGNVPRYKRYLDELEGKQLTTIWEDLYLSSHAKERIDYPTQKPIALYERIIKASSNEGDTVLDPFAGSGTTLDAAQSLNRKWIGIDQNPDAIALIEKRLTERHALFMREGVDYEVVRET